MLIPKANGAEDIERFGHYLDALEAKAGMPRGSVKIAVVDRDGEGDVRARLLRARASAPRRLTWGAEDLAPRSARPTTRKSDGGWTFPYQVARAQCLFAAAAAEVAPIDTLYADFRDPRAWSAIAGARAATDFVGRIAIHPDQVETINRCYTPSEEESRTRADRRGVRRQSRRGDARHRRQDVDIPHLKAARKTLARSERRRTLSHERSKSPAHRGRAQRDPRRRARGRDRSSTTTTGWRATTTANFRASSIARWRKPVGSGSPCRRNTAAPGLGVTEAAIMMHEVASHGGGMAAASRCTSICSARIRSW
jgi:citrate lyase beta subunit